MRMKRQKQEAGEEQSVNRANAGSLEDCYKAGDCLNGADALLWPAGESWETTPLKVRVQRPSWQLIRLAPWLSWHRWSDP